MQHEFDESPDQFGQAGHSGSISKRPDGYILTHVEGSKTPTVNNADIGTGPYTLNDNDMIELAGIKIQFFYK